MAELESIFWLSEWLVVWSDIDIIKFDCRMFMYMYNTEYMCT